MVGAVNATSLAAQQRVVPERLPAGVTLRSSRDAAALRRRRPSPNSRPGPGARRTRRARRPAAAPSPGLRAWPLVASTWVGVEECTRPSGPPRRRRRRWWSVPAVEACRSSATAPASSPRPAGWCGTVPGRSGRRTGTPTLRSRARPVEGSAARTSGEYRQSRHGEQEGRRIRPQSPAACGPRPARSSEPDRPADRHARGRREHGGRAPRSGTRSRTDPAGTRRENPQAAATAVVTWVEHTNHCCDAVAEVEQERRRRPRTR